MGIAVDVDQDATVTAAEAPIRPAVGEHARQQKTAAELAADQDLAIRQQLQTAQPHLGGLWGVEFDVALLSERGVDLPVGAVTDQKAGPVAVESVGVAGGEDAAVGLDRDGEGCRAVAAAGGHQVPTATEPEDRASVLVVAGEGKSAFGSTCGDDFAVGFQCQVGDRRTGEGIDPFLTKGEVRRAIGTVAAQVEADTTRRASRDQPTLPVPGQRQRHPPFDLSR